MENIKHILFCIVLLLFFSPVDAEISSSNMFCSTDDISVKPDEYYSSGINTCSFRKYNEAIISFSSGEPSLNTSNVWRPFFLSLFLSHGSGFYAMHQPKKAKPYLWANIFLIDIPFVIMAAGIISNKINPDLYQGTILFMTEYVVNTCLISFIFAIPSIRFFECWNIIKNE